MRDKIDVANHWIKLGYPKVVILKIVNVNRSSYYEFMKDKEKRSYANVGRKAPGYSYSFDGHKIYDIEIQKYIIELKNDKTCKHFGYKKITKMLRRKYKIKINKKKVRRLMKVLKLLSPNRKKYIRRVSRTCKQVNVTGSNQLWQMDIKYSFIAGTKETAYITSIIDVYDRSIVAYSLDLKCTGNIAKKVMIEALYNRNLKGTDTNLVLRTDNGSQFISGVFEEACMKEKVLHERIPVRSPNYNAFIESYHRYLQEECLTGMIYMSLNDIKYDVADFVYRYNTERIHSAIGYVPPYEYYLANVS